VGYCVNSLEFSFVFVHHLVVKYSDVSEECIASIFRVAEICSDVCRGDIEEELCWLRGMVRGRSVSHSYRSHEERLGLF